MADTRTVEGIASRLDAEISRLEYDEVQADAVGAIDCLRFDEAALKILKRIRGDVLPDDQRSVEP